MLSLRVLPWCLSITGAVVLSGCFEGKEQKLERFLLKGNLTLKEGDRERAIYYYQQALDIDPCYVHALNNMGTIYYQSNDYTKAVDYYDAAVKCDPAFLDAYFNRANALYDNREFYRAIEDIDHIIPQKSDTGRAHFVRGLILTELRRYEEAYSSFGRAKQIDNTLNGESLVNMAAIRYYQKQYDSAEIQLKQAMEINRREGNIYNLLALINIERENYPAALNYVNQALAIRKNGWYLNNRGYIFLKQGDLAKAEADINESITIDPLNAWAYRNKGILLLQTGDLVGAERVLTRAREIDATIDLLDYYFGMLYLARNNKTEACRLFAAAAQRGDVLATEQLKKCR